MEPAGKRLGDLGCPAILLDHFRRRRLFRRLFDIVIIVCDADDDDEFGVEIPVLEHPGRVEPGDADGVGVEFERLFLDQTAPFGGGAVVAIGGHRRHRLINIGLPDLALGHDQRQFGIAGIEIELQLAVRDRLRRIAPIDQRWPAMVILTKAVYGIGRFFGKQGQ